MKVLIIEDDYTTIEAVSLAFQIGWPDSKISYTRLGREGVDLVGEEKPDLILLDLGLPDISGFEVLKSIRLFSNIPIIVLTVASEEQSVVKALEWGADDYISKPFRQLELLARVKAASRKRFLEKEMPLDFGEVIFYVTAHTIKRDGKLIFLTKTESEILYYLALNAGHVITYKGLSQMVWNSDNESLIDTIRSHIKNLRKKIEAEPSNPSLIITKPGIGYCFASHPQDYRYNS